jgi:hypothetical protein
LSAISLRSVNGDACGSMACCAHHFVAISLRSVIGHACGSMVGAAKNAYQKYCGVPLHKAAKRRQKKAAPKSSSNTLHRLGQVFVSFVVWPFFCLCFWPAPTPQGLVAKHFLLLSPPPPVGFFSFRIKCRSLSAAGPQKQKEAFLLPFFLHAFSGGHHNLASYFRKYRIIIFSSMVLPKLTTAPTAAKTAVFKISPL